MFNNAITDLLAAVDDEATRVALEATLKGESDVTLQKMIDGIDHILQVQEQGGTLTDEEKIEPSYQLAQAVLDHIHLTDELKNDLETALEFERAADFLVVINGEHNSRLLVQERYEAVRATSLALLTGEDPYINTPEKDTKLFKPVYMQLNSLGIRVADGDDVEYLVDLDINDLESENQKYMDVYETGKLVYGNANPSSSDFNSLADFMFGDGFVEIKLPWQLLNFSNPSEMQIHDDYYEHYGVENLAIDRMWIGVGDGADAIPMFEFALSGWGENVTSHERLKLGYYLMQDIWTGERSVDEVLAESPLGEVDKGKPDSEPYINSSVVQSLVDRLQRIAIGTDQNASQNLAADGSALAVTVDVDEGGQ